MTTPYFVILMLVLVIVALRQIDKDPDNVRRNKEYVEEKLKGEYHG